MLTQSFAGDCFYQSIHLNLPFLLVLFYYNRLTLDITLQLLILRRAKLICRRLSSRFCIIVFVSVILKLLLNFNIL